MAAQSTEKGPQMVQRIQAWGRRYFRQRVERGRRCWGCKALALDGEVVYAVSPSSALCFRCFFRAVSLGGRAVGVFLPSPTQDALWALSVMAVAEGFGRRLDCPAR